LKRRRIYRILALILCENGGFGVWICYTGLLFYFGGGG
jgi:hypothetical protein